MLEAADLQVKTVRKIERDTEEDDTEPDEGALPKGSGPKGIGQPLQVGSFERRRDLVDGAGLCSLGKWRPKDRPAHVSDRLTRIREILMRAVDELSGSKGMDADHLFAMLAKGEVKENPFDNASWGRSVARC